MLNDVKILTSDVELKPPVGCIERKRTFETIVNAREPQPPSPLQFPSLSLSVQLQYFPSETWYKSSNPK